MEVKTIEAHTGAHHKPGQGGQLEPFISSRQLVKLPSMLQVAEYHERLEEAMGIGSVAVGVKALQIR